VVLCAVDIFLRRIIVMMTPIFLISNIALSCRTVVFSLVDLLG